MKKILVLILLTLGLFAQGLTPFAGVSMHAKQMENIDTKANNPLGLFGVRYEQKYYDLEFKHISSIPNVGNESKGLNLFGINGKYPYKFIDLYSGLSVHSEGLDGEYYSKQFSKLMYKGGIRVNYEDTRLFVEYIKSTDQHKADLFMYGIEWVFYPDNLLKK